MLKKSTFREIKTSLARYLAIFAIVALGVGFFSGLRDCKESMVSTASRYLERTNFYDYQILSSYGADDDSVALAESWDGVKSAEGSIQIDVIARSGSGDSSALKAISLPENINKLNVTEGRLPQNVNECVLDAYSITDEGFHVGDHIEITDENDKDKLGDFKVKDFEIVGLINTPIYLDYQRGSTDIGNGSLDTFFFIDKDAFDVDYYTNLYVKLDGDEVSLTDEHEDKLKEQEDNMKSLAEAVRDGRRETARKDAQEELDEKKQEYEDNLAKYEEEKADAERKLDKAEGQIKKGERLIDSNRKKAKKGRSEAESAIGELEAKLKEVDAGIDTLKSERKKAEDGLAQANSGKEQAEKGKAELEAGISKLQQAAQADPDNADKYNAQIAELNGQLAGVNQQISGIDAQIGEINAGISAIDAKLKEAESGKAQLEAGIAEAEKGIEQANSGLATLDKKEKELAANKRKLRNEEKKADSEFEKAKKKLDDAKDKLDEAQEKIDTMDIGNSYALSRKENMGYSSFDSNSSIVSNISKIFPLFFFLIAALVCMTTMTRMVDEQRTQIGILKALGYSNSQIVGKYMFYSGSAAFLGAVLGFFVGCKVFPAVIWHAYTMMYDFSHTVDYIINYKLGLAVLAVALLCSMGATWVSIAADFKVPPAELIRPKTPRAGKRILLERIKPLWNRISFLYKVSIRNIFRDKKRFLMMVIGVSGCTALLIAGIGIRATISKVADYQFDEISLYDITVIFSKNMTGDRQKDFLNEISSD
ncbi:MAG: FtsX-like permease family protein, partial [Mogibacterium sp.]|nr:FtsX-like permease family protein [Mogibacterium sp.]